MNASSNLETVNVATAHVPPTEDKYMNDASDNVRDIEFPTEEEMRDLRRVPGTIPWVTFTAAFVELCERFSYYGTTAVCEFKSDPSRILLIQRSRQFHPTTVATRIHHWCWI
jgi:hypothetical protein